MHINILNFIILVNCVLLLAVAKEDQPCHRKKIPDCTNNSSDDESESSTYVCEKMSCNTCETSCLYKIHNSCNKCCRTSCQTVQCRTTCHKQCSEPDASKPPTITPCPNNNSSGSHNITTIITFNSLMNQTNVIHVPAVATPGGQPENCCRVVHPVQCKKDSKFPYLSCFHPTSWECGPICTSTVINVAPPPPSYPEPAPTEGPIDPEPSPPQGLIYPEPAPPLGPNYPEPAPPQRPICPPNVIPPLCSSFFLIAMYPGSPCNNNGNYYYYYWRNYFRNLKDTQNLSSFKNGMQLVRDVDEKHK